MVASATASYLASHLNPGTILAGHASAALVQQSLVHGYVVGLLVDGGHLRGRRRGVRDAAAAGASHRRRFHWSRHPPRSARRTIPDSG
jgi:hypothetical protein